MLIIWRKMVAAPLTTARTAMARTPSCRSAGSHAGQDLALADRDAGVDLCSGIASLVSVKAFDKGTHSRATSRRGS